MAGNYGTAEINSFEILFPRLKEGGIYVVEDIESSYLNMYGGGPKKDEGHL